MHIKDVYWADTPRLSGVFGGHLAFGDRRRYWDFRSPGRGTIDFEAIIRAGSDPNNLAAIADAARDEANDATEPSRRAELLGILRDQLAAGLKQDLYLPAAPKAEAGGRALERAQLRAAASPAIIQALKLTLRALVRLRHRPEVPALVDALVAWLLTRLPNGSGIKILAAMHDLGAARAAPALAALVARASLAPELRHEALLATMVEPKHDLLAFPESPDHGR